MYTKIKDERKFVKNVYGKYVYSNAVKLSTIHFLSQLSHFTSIQQNAMKYIFLNDLT
jgi:hypothetical protein